MKKVLIIEDDPAISTGLNETMVTEGYKVLVEEDGEKGLNSALEWHPDIIILDIILPSMNGFDVCRNLRLKSINTPVLMLTSKTEEVDKILGLELGADDYVTKPFSVRELMARIKSLLRRTGTVKEFDTIKFDDITIDFKKMEFVKADKHVEMSLKEFEIMKYFIAHEGEVITRNMLLDEVWGYETFPTTRTVDNYILMLRKKVETSPSHPKHIITVHSAGYKFIK